MKNNKMGKQPKIDNKPDAKAKSRPSQSAARPSGRNDAFAPKGQSRTKGGK